MDRGVKREGERAGGREGGTGQREAAIKRPSRFALASFPGNFLSLPGGTTPSAN